MKYPFIVAEMGASHLQDLPRALAICEAAKGAGCDAIKLQTFTADTMVARGSQHRIEGGEWDGQDLWTLYEKCALPWSWHAPIFEHCRSIGLPCFSTPFDSDAIDLLERLGCPMYKIASFEILDLELISKAARTGKPLIISTGMATLAEIDDAVDAATLHTTLDKVTLLKCTSAYPAPASEANLATMAYMRQRWGCKVGLSDHTEGNAIAIAAAVMGADMIEKHMKLMDTEMSGPDDGFAISPHRMRGLVQGVRDAVDSVGHESLGQTESELPQLKLRRTLRVARDIKEGEALTRHNVCALRPAGGLPPSEINTILGFPAARDAKAGEPVTWELVRKDT